ncbi:MAG: penicillin-binding protein [Devosia sp. 67-54]|uniref:transglycosylase domain-containing protein n=1 Tax=unclassified Devosia TaxID=196773 RepID=UPI0009688BE8|nr:MULTISPECIES: PBP1A family penicillin-binding protein [unclassified Devosia]MBN9305628.1 PBP1A family penicillin-binding protein [Devosia sp.]OJX19196.1 MAG: penicillin-binding protein [Devosia sp. 67-54]
MQDPFYHKEKRRKTSRALDADAWLDSALYEFWQALGRGYRHIEDFFANFRVRGVRRFFVEIFSDGATFLAIGSVLMLALALPAFQAVQTGSFNKPEDISVTFLDRYGNEIGRRGIRSDDSYPLDKLPDYFVKAAISTEDRRFYDHFGVDIVGTLRALVNNAQGDNGTQGGSSITQQLAKNLFLSPERTVERKIKEAFLAVWLEWHYSKDDILKLYFDRAYMGGGNFGAAAAAEYYFGKKITDVNLAEAAMLAGLFKAPTKYAPTVDLAAARARANLVLSNMVDAGYMTEGQVAAARRSPATPIDHTAEINSPNYFLDWAFDRAKQIIADSKTTANSFVVRTTIDPVLQSYAEDAVTSVMRDNGERYNASQAAMVVTEPNGPVRAMVGGMDYGKSQFNRAVAALRQPGSSFKAFVYAQAFESTNMTPVTRIDDRYVCIGDWCPRNYEGNLFGNITLTQAFEHSVNTAAVALSIKTGRQPIADLAHKMGITSDFPVTRSLALGVAEVSVLDMTSAYSVFASGGYKTPAYGITKITTLRGDTVFDKDVNAPRERILSDKTVGYMDTLMRAVVTGGTGTRAAVDGVPAVGKTGTTSDYRDAWFVGFTGNYVAAVWYGNDDYHQMNKMTGGTLPAMTWQKFMAYAHTNIEVKPIPFLDFTPRPFVVQASTDGSPSPSAPQRPPTLKPDAAAKLLDIADQLNAALRGGDEQNVATLAVTPAPAGRG